MDMKISNAELPIGTLRAHLAQQYIGWNGSSNHVIGRW